MCVIASDYAILLLLTKQKVYARERERESIYWDIESICNLLTALCVLLRIYIVSVMHAVKDGKKCTRAVMIFSSSHCARLER